MPLKAQLTALHNTDETFFSDTNIQILHPLFPITYRYRPPKLRNASSILKAGQAHAYPPWVAPWVRLPASEPPCLLSVK